MDQLREITIIHFSISVTTKVSMGEVICDFFKSKLKNEQLDNNFKNEAEKYGIKDYISLQNLKDYKVTLNSNNSKEEDVKEVFTKTFALFSQKKKLRFYIHLKQEKIHHQLPFFEEEIIPFVLFKGNAIQTEKNIEVKIIKQMKFQQLNLYIKNTFGLSQTISIKYKNLRDNYMLSIQGVSKVPYQIFKQKRCQKIGIQIAYEAG